MLRRARRGFTLVELLMVMLVISLMAGIFMPRYITARDKGNWTACQTNLKNIAVALQTYSNDHTQTLPNSLAELMPNYMNVTLQCPTAQADTYSPSYQRNTLPNCFTVYCFGANHLNVVTVTNVPYYIFGQGLGP